MNNGRLQPDGGSLQNPDIIKPGWILQLPMDALGPGVKVGALPAVQVPGNESGQGTAAKSGDQGQRKSAIIPIDAATCVLGLAAARLTLTLIRPGRQTKPISALVSLTETVDLVGAA